MTTPPVPAQRDPLRDVSRFTGYHVRIPLYDGPLDLLLHLIRENEVDIHDIPIVAITEQYLEYIRMLEVLNIEVAGEFLVMAATLLLIKSQTLLPREETDEEDEEEGQDPRRELVQRLLEYKRYKDAAAELREYRRRRSLMYTRPSGLGLVGIPEPDPELALESVTLFKLLESFHAVLERVADLQGAAVPRETVTVHAMVLRIHDALSDRPQGLTFSGLCTSCTSRIEVIVTFIALLELIKRSAVVVWQDSNFDDITIRPAEGVDELAAAAAREVAAEERAASVA